MHGDNVGDDGDIGSRRDLIQGPEHLTVGVVARVMTEQVTDGLHGEGLTQRGCLGRADGNLEGSVEGERF